MAAKAKKRFFRFPEWTPEWVKLMFRVGYRVGILFLILGLLLSLFYWILARQYDLDKVSEVPASNIIYSDNQTEIAELAGNGRRLVETEEINQLTINALIAREDTNFFDHWGVDPRGLLRATFKNITSGDYKEGASTISMQLTKNTYNNKSKSMHRKLLEIFITLRLESRYEKDEILTHYLNRIYFGSGCYGIEEAAQTYFGVTTKDLTLAQSAMIVGIIRGPHIFSPFNNLEKAMAQRDQVLDRMLHLKSITEEQHDNAMTADIGLIKKSEKKKQKKYTSYSVQAIERHQEQIVDATEIDQGGLKIESTIDIQLLAKVNTDLKRILPQIPADSKTPLQIAVVVLENETGAIKAIVGGRDPVKYPYNRALDSSLELGSAYYPFLYLAALERGKLPIKNQPQVTGRQLDYNDMLAFSKRFGVYSNANEDPAELYRGGVSATPLELATAYSIIRNDGKRAESYLIESIKDLEGKVLFQHQPYDVPAVKPGTASSCRDLLHKAKSYSYNDIAYRYKHLWVISSSDKHTAVFWLGHDLPADIPNKELLAEELSKAMQEWVK